MRWRRIAEGGWAVGQAVLVFAVMTAGNLHPFLFDDNKSQWLPVADHGLEQFAAGRAPVWNPYLFCGIRVDDVGYYGLANPLMIAAHLVARTGISNTISLAIFFAFVGGSLFAHALARRLGSGFVRSSALVAIYQLGLTYWAHGHWYYVFNNFLMCPALFWAVHGYLDARADDARRHAAWGLGGLLGLAVGLGNIQYALCQWLIVAIVLGVPIAWERRWGEWRHLSRTAIAAGAIALPTVWMAATAGKYPVHLYGNSGSYPLSLWSAIQSNLGLGPLPQYSGPSDITHMAGLAIVLTAALVCLVRSRSPAAISGWAAALALALVVTFAGGVLIKSVPVFNKFRCAFKWWFLVPPLALELACLAPRLRPDGRWWRFFDRAAIGLGLVLAIAQAAPRPPIGVGDPSPGYTLDGFAELAEKLDTKNYRILPAFAGRQMDEFERHAFHTETPFIERHLTANAAVPLRVYSGIGYHIGLRNPVVDTVFPLTELLSFPVGAPFPLVEVRHRFPIAELGTAAAGKARLVPKNPIAAELVGARFQLIGPDGESLADNLVLGANGRIDGDRSMDALLWCVSGGELLILGARAPQSPDWLKHVRNAGVRYLILPSEQADDAIEILRSIRTLDEPWRLIRGQKYSAIELPTSAPLVSGIAGEPIPFVADAGGVTVFPTTDGTASLTIRFNHDPAFVATAESADGVRVRLPVTAVDGWMRVELPAGSWRRVEVRIEDRRVLAAIVLNILAIGLVIVSLRASGALDEPRETATFVT